MSARPTSRPRTAFKRQSRAGQGSGRAWLLYAAPILITLFLPTGVHARESFASVDEYGSLRMQSHKGATIDEKGIGWGTFKCSVVIALTLSGTRVTANYTAYLQGGSISGTAVAHIHSATSRAAAFSGTISLTRGTGSRAQAAGTAGFAGTINRTSYAMSTHITGRLRL